MLKARGALRFATDLVLVPRSAPLITLTLSSAPPENPRLPALPVHYGVLADFLVLDPVGFDLLSASDQMTRCCQRRAPEQTGCPQRASPPSEQPASEQPGHRDL